MCASNKTPCQKQVILWNVVNTVSDGNGTLFFRDLIVLEQQWHTSTLKLLAIPLLNW